MPEEEDRALGELCIRRGYVSMEQLHLLLMETERTGRPLAAILLKNQLLTPEQLDEIVEQLQNPSPDTTSLDVAPVTETTPVPPQPPPAKITKRPPSPSKTQVPPPPPEPAPARRSKPVPTVSQRRRSGLFKFVVVLLLLGGAGAAGYFYVWPKLKPPEPPPPPPPSAKLASMYADEDASAFQEQIEKSLAFDRRDPEAWFWLARAAARDYFHAARLRAPWTFPGSVEIEPIGGDSALSADCRARALKALDEAAACSSNWKLIYRMPVVEGLRRLLGNKPRDAVASFQEALDAAEDDPEVRVLFALALYLDGKFHEAASEALKRFSSSAGRTARVVYARAQLGAGLREGDAELFSRGLNALPKESPADVLTARAELWLALYELQREHGDSEGADKTLELAQQAGNSLATSEEGYGTAGLVNEAVARLREEQGLGSQAVAKYQAAIDFYAKALNEGIKGPAWNLRRATAQMALARYHLYRGRAAALALFKDARAALVSEYREYPAVRIMVLCAQSNAQQALLRSTQPVDTVQALEKQISDLAKLPEEVTALARAHLDLARYQAARSADAAPPFEAALKLLQGRTDAASLLLASEAYRERARAKPSAADLQAAIESASKANAGFPSQLALADAWTLSAVLKSRAGEDPAADFEEALKACEAALKLRPAAAGAIVRLADARILRAGHLARANLDPSADEAEAMKAVEDALKNKLEVGELFTARAEIRLNFAMRKVSQGADPSAELNETIKDSGAGLEIAPSQPRAFVARGTARTQLGILHSKPGQSPEADLKPALDDFASALRLAENDPDALRQRGRAKSVWGEFMLSRNQDPMEPLTGAVRDLTDALRYRPSDPYISADRAHAHSLIGKFRLSKGTEDLESFKACAEDATRALERSRTDSTLRFDRGRALYYVGKFEDSIKDLEEAKKLNSRIAEEADTLIALARLAIQHGGRR